MATIRLIPSTYTSSNTNYVTVTNPSYMYQNTDDSSNYATLRGRAGRNYNSAYYAFIHGFNFEDVPSAATVTGFRVLIKAYRGSYQATGNTSYRICLASQASNSYKIGNTTLSEDITTSTSGEVYEIPTGSLTWETLSGYGSNFSIDVPLRNSSTTNTNYPYVYVYGAEIEVTYSMPNPHTVTSTLTGDGTISPSGATSTYEGAEYELTITPTVKTDTVTVTQDGVDITSQLVPHYTGGEQTVSAVLGTYSLISGSFNGSGASYFQGIVGNGHTASQTSSNYYSSSSGTQAIFQYEISFSGIPSNASITRLYMIANGHAESTSNNNEYMCVQLKSGTTELSEQYNFKSYGTSNGNVTIEADTLPTLAQLDDLVVEMTLGYYGGVINGVTVYLEYIIPSGNPDYYTYTYTVSSNSTINVTIISRPKYTVTATSEVAGITVSPATQDAYEGDNATVILNDNTNIVVTDNDVDVTSQLQFRYEAGETQTFTGIPTSFDESSTYGSIYEGTTSSGLSSHTDTTRICCYVTQTAYAEARLIYNFDCSSIPQNATITSVSCIASAACYSNGQYFDVKTLQLYSGNTPKGTAATITGNGNTRTEHNISGGSWSRSELNNAKIVLHIQRGNNTTEASFSFWGATLTVTYSVPQSSYYEYTITNVQTNHTIIVSQGIIVPIDEDPEKTYYPVTVSSINASTDPINGTTRIEGGTSSTITIYPTDPQLTLITDNGVDVSSQLVAHGGTISDPVVSTAPGASYGFNLNSSTGYYVSTNGGVSKSASVARVTFNLPVRCLVTIQYINYAEANYDYGMFGKIDTSVATDGLTASSTSSSPSDSTNNYQLAMASNNANAQTITYTIESGEHFIDIKYGKDDASDDNNDSLQWKITSIEPLESNVAYYTYALSNVDQDHSLIFIFGDVTYYFVNSSTTTNCKLYPNGSTVKLPGDTYSMTIVPNDVNDQITLRDNNVDVTSSLERTETNIEKNGNTIRVVNYQYTLSNVQATHNLIVYSINGGRSTYIKTNGSWNETTFIRKESNKWSNITYTKVWVHNGTSWVESPNRTIVASGIIFKET